MLKVLLDGVDITNRVLSCNVYKRVSFSNGINPNEAIIELDNSDNYYTADALPSEDTKLEILYDDVKHFTGYIFKPKMLSKSSKLTINARDYWKIMEKRTLPNLVFLNQRFLDVLKKIIEYGGENPANIVADDPDISIPFLHFEEGTKVVDAILKLLASVDGFVYYDGEGILNFRTIFARQNYTGTYQTINIVDEINANTFENLTFQKQPAKCNIATVEIQTKTVKDEIEVIYFGATSDKPFKVPVGGYPEDSDDKFYVDFDEPVWWMEQYNDIEFAADQDNVFVNQGVYESNFLDNIANPGVLKNPWKIELRIENNSGVDANITTFTIEGKKVDTVHFVASSGTGTPKEEYKLTSEVIGDKDWAKRLADWLLTVKGEKWQFDNIKVVDFDKHSLYELGNKVSVIYSDYNISENALIDEIALNFDNYTISLKLSELKGETYSYPGGVGGTEEGPGGATTEGDGAPPPAPSSISATPGIGLITVSWSSVVSAGITDFGYYELQRSVDGGAYTTIALTETNSFVDEDVVRSSTYKYRVRSWDVEGYYSNYTELTSTVQPAQAGTDDIGDETITANKLTVSVDLSVGRKITVGSDVELGNEVFNDTYAGMFAGDATNGDGVLITGMGINKVVDGNLFEIATIIKNELLDFDGSVLTKRIELPELVPIDRLKVFTSFNSLQNPLENTFLYTTYEIIPDASDPTMTKYVDITAAQVIGRKKYIGSIVSQYGRNNPGTKALNSVSFVEMHITFYAKHQSGTYKTNIKTSHKMSAISNYTLKFTVDNYNIVQYGIGNHEGKIYIDYTINWGDGSSKSSSVSIYEGKWFSNFYNPQPTGWPYAKAGIYAVIVDNANSVKPIKALVNTLIFLE